MFDIVYGCYPSRFSFDDPFFQKMIGYSKQQDEFLNDFSVSDFSSFGRYLPLSKVNTLFKEQCDILLGYIDDVFEEHKKNFNKGKLVKYSYEGICSQFAKNDT